jgi:hypothetical protein
LYLGGFPQRSTATRAALPAMSRTQALHSSSVHLTSTASATGLLVKVLIPDNDKLVANSRACQKFICM